MPNNITVDRCNSIISELYIEPKDWYLPGLDDTEVISGILTNGFSKFVMPGSVTPEQRRDEAIAGYFHDNERIGLYKLTYDPLVMKSMKQFINEALGRDILNDRDAWFGPG